MSFLAFLLVIFLFLFPLNPALACPEDMIQIPGGSFRMGSDDFFPEERAAEAVQVKGN